MAVDVDRTAVTIFSREGPVKCVGTQKICMYEVASSNFLSIEDEEDEPQQIATLNPSFS